MSLPRQIAAAAALLVLVWALTACGPPGDTWDGPFESPSAEIVVDLAGRRGERIPVQETLVGFDFTGFKLSNGSEPEYRFHDIRLSDGKGREVECTKNGKSYTVGTIEGDTLVIRYEAQPGGMGRHGRQGLVAEDFAVFDGRLYPAWRGGHHLRSARIRFIAPADWTVASPFRRAGDWYYLDELSADITRKTLNSSCVGVGRFDHATRTFGETEARVATYSGWDKEHKDMLVDKTFRMMSHFHSALGFDLKGAYAVVWTPRSGEQRVFGGAFANGACFEHPPEGTHRNWQLLGHRLGHSMNKFQPTGMSYAEREDRWFQEGFASYVEVTSTEATGIVESQAYWNALYRGCKLGPEKDIAMANEPGTRAEDREFVHYLKAPLVVKMLDDQMVARSGKTVEQFMHAMWQKHGWFRSELALKDELEAFTGTNFDDFWALMIEQPGLVIPVWPEYIMAVTREHQKRPPAATVGGNPVSGDYLYYLASHGEFETFAQIREHLVMEQSVRDRLADLRVRLYPEELRDHIHGLISDDRYRIAQYEANYMKWLAPDDTAGEVPAFEINEDDPDGRIFAQLLAVERRYLQQIKRGPLENVLVRRDSNTPAEAPPYRLGFALDMPVTLETNWREPQPSYRVEVGARGETWKIRTPDSPNQPKAWARAAAADRGNQPGIVTFEVSATDGSSVTRAFWQRGEAAGRPNGGRGFSEEELERAARRRAARKKR